MPRIVDHDQRRAQIARAFQRVLAAEGVANASFSRVAAEAGLSIGLIQHYFSGRNSLLRYAYADALDHLGARIRVRIRAGAAAGCPTAEILLDSLAELLPLDEQRTMEYRVRQGLLAQSAHDPDLAELARRSGGAVLRHVTEVVQDGVRRGEVDGDVDAQCAARMILATVQGLAEQVTLSGSEAFSARGVLRPVVALVFSGDDVD